MKDKNFLNAKIISFEGIEACGKSTQIELLKEYLDENKITYLALREPGSNDTAEKIRDLLLNKDLKKDPLTEILLFMAARRELFIDQIVPNLNKKKVFILDRSIDSTLVYQAMAHDLDWEYFYGLHEELNLCIVPHRTFYFQMNYENSIERQKTRNQEQDYFEQKPKRYYTKLISGYDYLSQRFPDRFVTINADETIQSISTKVRKVVMELLDR
ncbi:dTMP kinase [Bacteriovoracaceae bacterium]|nr:dTMP kinase [Bacteriovoracaceae bacterium]